MSTEAAVEPTGGPATDERLRTTALWRRLLIRPSVSALWLSVIGYLFIPMLAVAAAGAASVLF